MIIHTFDNKRYIALGDLWKLAHDCARKAREGKEPGFMCEDEGQRIASEAAYRHICTEIMIDKIHEAKCPEDIRKMHRDIWKEYYAGRYAIRGKGEDGPVYFRKYCDQVEEGKDTPVFTESRKEAALFDDHACACAVRDSIAKEYNMDDLDVIDGFMLDNELCKMLLDAIFSEE